MAKLVRILGQVGRASMGPGSDNPGYGLPGSLRLPIAGASMGSGFYNPGFVAARAAWLDRTGLLQWVRGLITPVMIASKRSPAPQPHASMGPGSDNPGYGRR